MSYGESTVIADTYGTRLKPLSFEFPESAVRLALQDGHTVWAQIKGKPGVFEIHPIGKIMNYPEPPKDQAEASARVAGLAAMVRDNRQFANILMQVDASKREDVYAEIGQHLTFTPLSYRLLMLMGGKGFRQRKRR